MVLHFTVPALAVRILPPMGHVDLLCGCGIDYVVHHGEMSVIHSQIGIYWSVQSMVSVVATVGGVGRAGPVWRFQISGVFRFPGDVSGQKYRCEYCSSVK